MPMTAASTVNIVSCAGSAHWCIAGRSWQNPPDQVRAATTHKTRHGLLRRTGQPIPACRPAYSTLIVCRFDLAIFGRVSSSMPSLKSTLALEPSTLDGSATVRLKEPREISQR